MNQVITRVITADHPCLSGHFPGNPIVPGVVLLEQVIDAIQQVHPEMRVSGFTAVKFVSVLLPGEAFSIQLESVRNHSLKFRCIIDDRVIANGQARLTSAQTAGSPNAAGSATESQHE